jgi:hypothetical protein
MVRATRREDPSHASTNVVRYEMHFFGAACVDQRVDVVDELRHPVIASAFRPGTG